MVIQLTQIYQCPEDERRARYLSENPEEAKILEEFEKKMFKQDDNELCDYLIKSTLEKLGGITEIELDRKLIKLHGEYPSDIKDFERIWGVKY